MHFFLTFNEWMDTPCCCPLLLPLWGMQIVRSAPDLSLSCDMSQWHTNKTAERVADRVPHGCESLQEVIEKRSRWPPNDTLPGAFYIHVKDSGGDGVVANQCSELGHTLLRSASSIASSQDTVASGLRDGAFLDPKPELKSLSEVVLSIVTAVQGVAVAFLLLFVDADARAGRMLDWWRSLCSRVRGLPQPPPVQVANLPGLGLDRLRGWLLALTVCLSLYVYDCSPVGVAPMESPPGHSHRRESFHLRAAGAARAAPPTPWATISRSRSGSMLVPDASTPCRSCGLYPHCLPCPLFAF